MLGGLGLSAPAFAEGDCNSIACLPGLDIQLNLGGAGAGIGSVVGNGDEFFGEVTKEGTLNLSGGIQYQGPLCGPKCGNGDVWADLNASEMITATGLASGGTPGEIVSVENAMVGQAVLGLQLNVSGITVDD